MEKPSTARDAAVAATSLPRRPRKVQLNLPQDASRQWIFSHRFFLNEGSTATGGDQSDSMESYRDSPDFHRDPITMDQYDMCNSI